MLLLLYLKPPLPPSWGGPCAQEEDEDEEQQGKEGFFLRGAVRKLAAWKRGMVRASLWALIGGRSRKEAGD